MSSKTRRSRPERHGGLPDDTSSGPLAECTLFPDGSAETLQDVILRYDGCLDLGLSDQQVTDLVEYLKSL